MLDFLFVCARLRTSRFGQKNLLIRKRRRTGAQQIFPWLVRIRLRNEFPADRWGDFSFWYIGVHDEHGSEIYRRDLSPNELKPLSVQQPEIELVCELQSGSVPVSWTVWPVSRTRGWLARIEGKLGETDFTILLGEE